MPPPNWLDFSQTATQVYGLKVEGKKINLKARTPVGGNTNGGGYMLSDTNGGVAVTHIQREIINRLPRT
ncbi:MAG: hypothetical protein SNJ77_12735 [Cytophagales bacterium]